MDKLKITAVSYLNTFPFVHGILRSGKLENFRLDLEVPSVCAEKLYNGDTDIALVPVGAIMDLSKVEIITDYCIGAVSKVKTVLLLSRKPLREIRTIHLDNDSRTSVALVKVLASKYWKIDPEWVPLKPGESMHPEAYESIVAIGDKTFGQSDKFSYIYDLAEEWISFTSLPFVFAVWLSKKRLGENVIRSLNDALSYGIKHREESLEFLTESHPPKSECLSYLQHNISYELDEKKKEGMKLFLDYLRDLTK
jgi:chorismate dehydratase